jgi:HAD superfamily hydrolase (TIGR01509 family)
MKYIRAFLFDMDGVVTDTEPQYDLFLGRLRDEYQLASDFVDQVKGVRLPDILAKYFPHLPEEDKNKINDKVIDFELNIMKYEPIPGIPEFIRSVKQEGYKVGLVTSSLRIKVEVALKELNMEEFFDALVTGDDVEKGKPAPDGYLLGARKLEVKPEECLVFEDSFAGIEAGKRAGMRVIGVATTNPEESLKGKADKIIPNFLNIKTVDILT